MDQIISIRYLLDSKVIYLLYNWFDEYINAILKYALNFDWSMYDVMFCCSMVYSMLWYGEAWNRMVFYIVLFSSMVCYIVVECVQSVF